MKTTLTTLTLRVLMLFPVFTLLSFVPGANTMLVILSLALVAVVILRRGISKRNFLILLAALGSTIINLFVTDQTIINYNEVIYLGYMCAYFTLITDNKEQFKQFFLNDTRYIRGICIIWNVFVLISFLFKSSYEEGVFVSFAGDTFRLSPSALFILILSSILIVTRGRKNIVFSILPILSILLGSSRTYFLLGCLCLAISLYFVVTNKRYYFILLGLMAAVCIAIVLNSSMGEKILDSFKASSYRTQLAVFTNGRATFWVRDINAYLDQPLFNRIFGCGYNFIRIVNGAIIGTSERGLWAHNDFLQVMITNGLFGLMIYLYTIVQMFKAYMDKRLPRIMRITIVLIWWFNAFFNMYFTYMCAMLSLPILLIACEYGYASDESDKLVV